MLACPPVKSDDACHKVCFLGCGLVSLKKSGCLASCNKNGPFVMEIEVMLAALAAASAKCSRSYNNITTTEEQRELPLHPKSPVYHLGNLPSKP